MNKIKLEDCGKMIQDVDSSHIAYDRKIMMVIEAPTGRLILLEDNRDSKGRIKSPTYIRHGKAIKQFMRMHRDG